MKYFFEGIVLFLCIYVSIQSADDPYGFIAAQQERVDLLARQVAVLTREFAGDSERLASIVEELRALRIAFQEDRSRLFRPIAVDANRSVHNALEEQQEENAENRRVIDVLRTALCEYLSDQEVGALIADARHAHQSMQHERARRSRVSFSDDITHTEDGRIRPPSEDELDVLENDVLDGNPQH
jgi:regulator of replication initiation timing